MELPLAHKDLATIRCALYYWLKQGPAAKEAEEVVTELYEEMADDMRRISHTIESVQLVNEEGTG